jgi:hypothetical protein
LAVLIFQLPELRIVHDYPLLHHAIAKSDVTQQNFANVYVCQIGLRPAK